MFFGVGVESEDVDVTLKSECQHVIKPDALYQLRKINAMMIPLGFQLRLPWC